MMISTPVKIGVKHHSHIKRNWVCKILRTYPETNIIKIIDAKPEEMIKIMWSFLLMFT